MPFTKMRQMSRRVCTLVAGLWLLGCSACMADPAVVYEAVQFDDSFNVAAYDGIQRYKAEGGVAVQAFGAKAIRRFAEAGAEPIIAIGVSLAEEIARAAEAFPQRKFILIDAVVDAPNVQSVVFRNQEGAFLVGMLAALSSRTGKVGFVGGMDIPVIREFQCGYSQGVQAVAPRTEVFTAMTGTTSQAWNNPERGAELARLQYARGVDVIFAAAGGTGLGVYQVAKAMGKQAIGVDRNQNFLYPGTMLSSMVKRIDVAVYMAAKSVRDGSYRGGGILSLGVKENGIGWALDKYNRALVSPEMQKRLEGAQKDIATGKLQIQPYLPIEDCQF